MKILWYQVEESVRNVIEDIYIRKYEYNNTWEKNLKTNSDEVQEQIFDMVRVSQSKLKQKRQEAHAENLMGGGGNDSFLKTHTCDIWG